MKRPFLSVIIALCGSHAWSSLEAGEIWDETSYIIGGNGITMEVPSPGAGWKMLSKRRISLGKDVQGFEEIEGPERGTTSWLVEQYVVSLKKDGETVVYPRNLGEASLWSGLPPDLAALKGRQPAAEVKNDGRDVLVYETDGGRRRVWIVPGSRLPVAVVEGRVATVFVKVQDLVEVKAPPSVTEAVENTRRQEKKLGEFGSMPQ